MQFHVTKVPASPQMTTRDVFMFAQKPRRSRPIRGRVVFIDHTIHDVVVALGDGQQITAAMDPRDETDSLRRIANASDPAMWIDCEVVKGVVTQFFLVSQDEEVVSALRNGGWNIEEDVINLCKSVWREARVPYSSITSDVERCGNMASVPKWRMEHSLFPHQRKTVCWMRDMEKRFPSTIYYDGNIRITEEWFVDTESECFTKDSSPRSACLMGGICADGMGKGKTASALRLVSESEPFSNEPDVYESRASLFLLPLNLVGQWKREIEKFLNTDLMKIVFLLHGRNLPLMNDLLEADMVVTTFHFLKSNRTYNDMVDRCLKNRGKERSSLSSWCRTPGHQECLVEAIMWRRIIIDEMHQIFERMADTKHFRLFRSRAIWGLTATPTLDNDQAQHLYALLTREKTHHPNLMSRLIEESVAVHSETALSSFPKRSLCMVSLSAEERILLGDVNRDTLADKVRKVTFVDVHNHTDGDSVEGHMIASRRRDCAAIQARIRGHERSVRILETVEQELLEDYQRSDPNPEVKRASKEALDAHVEDLQVARDMLLRQRMILNEKEVMAETLQQRVSQIREETTCNMCGKSPGLKFFLLSNCFHMVCSECVSFHGVCGVCGEVIQDMAPFETTRGVGTKMREIVALIQSLGEASILFVQWKSMLKGTRSFLRSFEIKVHTLDGNSTQRTNALQSLADGGVLLLCLEDGFAGLHLPHVTNVIFAHAIVGDRDRVLRLESQAISRCVRYGQTKPVNTYSFVVSDTEEEALYEMTHGSEC